MAHRAQQFTPHKQCLCSVIRDLTWLETSPLLSGALECQKKEQLALGFGTPSSKIKTQLSSRSTGPHVLWSHLAANVVVPYKFS